MRGEGLVPKFLMYHHGDKYMNNDVTWYDQDYNKRERSGPNKLPELREFSSHVMAWIPEKTDHPIQGLPSSYRRFIFLHSSK